MYTHLYLIIFDLRLLFQAYASKAPNLSFIHAHPGLVRTPLLTSSPSFLLRASSSLLLTLSRPWNVAAEECAEYMWHAAYKTAAQPGAYRTDSLGESLGKKNYFGDDEQRAKVWEHTAAVMREALETAS